MGRSFNCKITIDALGIALPGYGNPFDNAVFLSMLEVVFVWLHVDGEQAGKNSQKTLTHKDKPSLTPCLAPCDSFVRRRKS